MTDLELTASSSPCNVEPLFHIVLFQPEIPNNTGSIGRTCVGLGAKLWLVRPLGFQITDSKLRRAGLDYWPHLNWEPVDDWEMLLRRIAEDSARCNRSARYWFFSKKGTKSYCDVVYERGDVFVFGTESTGLPDRLPGKNQQNTLAIPIEPQIRSLNLSVSVGVALFEALRQVRPNCPTD